MKSFKSFLSENKTPIRISSFDRENMDDIIGTSDIYDVQFDVNLKSVNLSNSNVRFNKVDYDFILIDCKISNPNIFPIYVGGDFDISANHLSTLKGTPSHVGGHYLVHGIKTLTSLEGAPKIVNGIFSIQLCESIKSFEHIPEQATLHDVGYTGITSLIDIHKHIKKTDSIKLDGNIITEGGIGLLLINNLKSVSHIKNSEFGKAYTIIEKHLGKGKSGLLECQEELEEAGLEAFAKL